MSNLNNTLTYLNKVKPKVLGSTKGILTRERRNASNRLYNSLDIEVFEDRNMFYIDLTFADHGKYVLDSRRRYKKNHPSTQAVNQLKKWITQKGISIGGGRITTVQGKSNTQAKSQSNDAKLTSFAKAIWYKNKKQGRTSTPKNKLGTNFLKPFNNMSKDKTFREGLKTALALDTQQQTKRIWNDAYKGKAQTIIIKM